MVSWVERGRSRLGQLAAGLAGRLGALRGWRRVGAAVLLGGLATFALPPAGLVPVLLLALPGLVWLLAGAESPGAAFRIGWWWGFGHFFLGLYWISFALLTDPWHFGWLMPLALCGPPAVLALFVGLAGLVLQLLRQRLGLSGIALALALAVLWSGGEWLRGHLLTGFPWQLIGYAWVGVLPVLQSTAVIGVYGLGLLTVVVAVLPAALGDPREPAGRALAASLAGLVLLAAVAGAGAWRLAGAPTDPVPDVRLRLVQAAIPQTAKRAAEQREANFQQYLELSAGPSLQGPPSAILWPETAVPFFLEQDAARRQAVAGVAPEGGLVLTGAPRAARLGPDQWQFWNSLLAIDETAQVIGRYDKFHLVPFGEYLPGRQWLPDWLPLGTVAAGASDFSPGPGPATLDLPGLPPVSPLICYEVIFPAAVVDPEHRPAWLLNLTNDAWYGRTAGPYQHFAIARVRAVEEGLPLVRVANTGISGVVDAYGRITAQLGLGERGVLDAVLPRALNQPTLYGRFGDWGLALMLLGCVISVIFARQPSRLGS